MTKSQVPMTKRYDLEERTAKFGEEVIGLVRNIKQNPINCRVISQLVGSGGSIGANYCEAIDLFL